MPLRGSVRGLPYGRAPSQAESPAVGRPSRLPRRSAVAMGRGEKKQRRSHL
jgi:hypothetical protein